MKPAKTLITCVFLASAAGCAADGTKTGNGVQLELAAVNQALTQSDTQPTDAGLASIGLRDQQGTSLVLDQAVLVVSEIELRAKGTDLCAFERSADVDCTNGRLRLRGLFELDLLAPESSELAAFSFPAVVYDQVEVRTEALDKDSQWGAVSFYLTGRMQAGAEETPFVVSLKRNVTLRFEELNGVSVRAGEWLSARIDLAAWFAHMPLTDCIERGDVETIEEAWVFSEDSKCKEIENSFLVQLNAATRLARRRD